ncbi:thiamine pyrophosphate-binding protein [Pleionea mediterranea]|uniref:Acetolactate synthase-1/2/3 large subunit n=1 Tax=Pleionea mediterranea TaxID=523701 RepID=A0A316FSY3_9GAMM|nr:thiamine pyrophosphate-binding protein [Pleionea mediterranea]PWK50730.1 acetolactate synthase-1/2/3 large subunit [Pleionea mediterranea]
MKSSSQEWDKKYTRKISTLGSDFDNADLIIEYLIRLGIDYVFGVPGGAIEPFFNAIFRAQSRGGPKLIVARHEAGAAFMADGYARETGRIGVCCATTGPGATNLITGVASAMVDYVPMLVITAQTPLPKFGRNALQESSCTAIDTVGIFRHCTRYNTLISHSEQMNAKLISALMAANRSPVGPAHISIPSDILREKITSNTVVRTEHIRQNFILTDNQAVQKFIDLLTRSWRIAVFIGKGCGDAIEEIMRFAEMTHSPIMVGPAGKRWMNSYHPSYRGVFGFAGHPSAIQTMADDSIDLLIAVGTPLTELGTGGWKNQLLSERLVHVDSTVEHFTRSPMAKLHVCGDIKAIFEQVNSCLEEGKKWGRTWDSFDPIKENYLNKTPSTKNHGYQIRMEHADACEDTSSPLKPQCVVTEFAHRIPENFRIHLDAGNVWGWFTHYFHRPSSKGHYHISMGFGSMGWAIGAAIGNTLGSQQPSVCITGDGSYLMSGQEITVALQHQLTVIYVIFNDSALGMVKHGQRLGDAEQIGFELPDINYAQMANAMGIEGIVIKTFEELISIDWKALGSKNSPTLIDLRIDGEQVPPMGERVKGLANESATPGG